MRREMRKACRDDLIVDLAYLRRMDYFKRLSDLLKTERKEDQRAYQELTQRLSVQERRANGLTWYPVAIRGTEMSRGDYLTVEVERTTNQDIVHQFRFGAAAQLFSNHDPKNNAVAGVISYQGADKLKITLRTDELPDWSRDGKLGIDLLFDDNSYDEMEYALKQASSLVEKKDADLVRVLVGEKSPTFEAQHFPFDHPSLNDSQKKAVDQIISANELAIVHGPPGTGKTTTLVQAIKALMKKDKEQILVTAPSNAAVDLLTEKLSDEGLNVVRVGNPARVSEKLMSLTLDSKMYEHARTKEIKKLRKQAAEFRDMAHKYKRNFGKAERDQRKALFDEARNIMKEVENSEKYIVDDILSKANVITATLVGANHYTVRHMNFHTAVIDEAGQALEPACWIPILKSKKLILAGDHCQLPPTIKSDEAARNGLGKTLLEKCVQNHPQAVVLLEEQYRMHENIMAYSSLQFYNSRLKAHASVANRLLLPDESPVLFIDTAGCGFDEKTEGTSTTNPEEAHFLLKHLRILTDKLIAEKMESNLPTVAVISPYKRQVDILKEAVHLDPYFKIYGDKIAVNTIDSFQGQERDIVYIGMTRSNADNRIGFLSEIRRMNVAMTRAKKKLVVIGDSATLSQSSFYAGFINYTEQAGMYISAWEFMN